MQILLSGGAGSGKSQLAERLTVCCQEQPRYYFATMQVWDAECAARIARHQQQRAGKGFQTIEVPYQLRQTAERLPAGGCGLLECVSNLLSNEQFGQQQAHPADEILDGIAALSQRLDSLVIVSNEIFTDRKPRDAAMQRYAQQLGKINCALAADSDIVIEVSSGIPILWKGADLFHAILF
jgi:adenosylcobinamide kinase/adenosylcobinamide-phosphate guanylyltransferase